MRKEENLILVLRFIALGTIQAATDLLEKKGSIYSSRPRNIVAGEILCRNMRGLGMPYGQRWRNWRSVSLELLLGFKFSVLTPSSSCMQV